MDQTALYKLSSGVYILGARDGARTVGCVVNTVTQATSKPLTLTVCVHRDNYTNACIKKDKAFSVSILSEQTKESTIRVFGFASSRDSDKFAQVPFGLTPSGLPYVSEGVTGWLECRVLDYIDHFTHTIFIAEVVEAENLHREPPLTYAYYHSNIKGKAPAPAAGGHVCGVCGYVYPGSDEDFAALPEDYTCPVCGVAKSMFKPN